MPRAVALIEVKAPMPASGHGLAMWLFEDRQDAGQQLAQRLAAFDLGDAVVVALPRGGLPIAAPIAARFRLPIDVLLIRKVGVPGQRERVSRRQAAHRARAFVDLARACLGQN